MSWRRMDSLKEQSLSKIAPPLASHYLRTLEATKETNKKKRDQSIVEARLSNLQRSEDLLIASIEGMPDAPPVWGIYGKGWNLVKEVPEVFVGGSTWAFHQKGFYLAADAYLSTLE
jgi:hypothetical protein